MKATLVGNVPLTVTATVAGIPEAGLTMGRRRRGSLRAQRSDSRRHTGDRPEEKKATSREHEVPSAATVTGIPEAGLRGRRRRQGA